MPDQFLVYKEEILWKCPIIRVVAESERPGRLYSYSRKWPVSYSAQPEGSFPEKSKEQCKQHVNKVQNCHPWPYTGSPLICFPHAALFTLEGDDECLFLATSFVWVYIKLSLKHCSFDKALNFFRKNTYGELLLTLLTQQTKARPADVSHSRQKEGTGRANSKEPPHGKRLECFIIHSAKRHPFPLFLLSRLNVVAQPNLLLNSVSGEQQAHSLASSCAKCFRNSWDIPWQHHRKKLPIKLVRN